VSGQKKTEKLSYLDCRFLAGRGAPWAMALISKLMMENMMNLSMKKQAPVAAAFMLCAMMATYAVADQTVLIGHVAPLTG
jgi:hypothetical protein